MSRKQKQLVRKPSRKIADARRVRFGAGWSAPTVRTLGKSMQDKGTVRFGAGWSAPSLRK